MDAVETGLSSLGASAILDHDGGGVIPQFVEIPLPRIAFRLVGEGRADPSGGRGEVPVT